MHQSRGAQPTAGLGLQAEITVATFSSNPRDQDMPS